MDKNKNLYFAFDIEKVFDKVPHNVLCWAMQVLGVPEWIVVFVQAIYNGAESNVRVNCSYSDEFDVKVGVHQGSVVLEALSSEFCKSCPLEPLYADDLVLIADLLMEKWKLLKDNMENGELCLNMTKTKVMIGGKGLNTIKPSVKYPCSVYRKEVGCKI